MAQKTKIPASGLEDDFDRAVDEIKDPQHQLTAKCMKVVLAAVEVGADVDRLVERTGYARDFIDLISQRMRQAGLWMGKVVDNLGWPEKPDDWAGEFELFLQAQVAIGAVKRELKEDGRCRYIDAETGDPVTDWSPRDESALARSTLRSMRG